MFKTLRIPGVIHDHFGSQTTITLVPKTTITLVQIPLSRFR
jgi:hypothetical protein